MIWTSPNYPEYNPQLSGIFPDENDTPMGGGIYSFWWFLAPNNKTCLTILYTIKPGYNYVSFPFQFYTGGSGQDQSELDFIIKPSTYPTINTIIGGLDGSSASTVVNGAWVGSISNILATAGYFIHNSSSDDVILEVRGASLVGTGATDVVWGSGNNLVSYPLNNERSLTDAISYDLTTDNINKIITDSEATFWLDSTNEFIGSLDTFTEGSGYWINLDNSYTGTFWEDNDTPKPMTGHPLWIEGTPKSEWEDQPFQISVSTLQCFYMIGGKARDINGNDCIPGEDWIGIFRGNTCCGSWWYNGDNGVTYSDITDENNNPFVGIGHTTIPAMMKDGNLNPWSLELDPEVAQRQTSFGYFNNSETPTFVIYKHSEQKYYLAKLYNTAGTVLEDMSSYTAQTYSIYIAPSIKAVSEII